MRALVLFLLLAISSVCFSQTEEQKIAFPFLPAKKWALCIGASNYKSIGKLDFAAKDSIDFGKTLRESFGFSDDTVKVLADAEGYTEPTSNNVNQALETLLKSQSLDSGDLFIVYFSGHGVGLPSGDYWLPTDATPETYSQVGISVKGILEKLAERKLRNVVIISDACRAGEKNGFGRSLIELGRKTNIAVFLGCAPGAKSYEIPKFGHGAFTYFLMRALKNKSGVEKETGALRLSKLGNSVASAVQSYTQTDYGDNAQKPTVWADKEQEVILAAYPPLTGDLKSLLDSYKDMEKSADLSGEQYRDFLLVAGSTFYDQKRYQEAAEILKTLQGLGEQRVYFRYVYIASLVASSRYFEALRYGLTVQEDVKDSFLDDVAMLLLPAGHVQRARAVSAIWNIYNSEGRDALLYRYDVMFNHISAYSEIPTLIERLRKDYPNDPILLSYVDLLEASDNGKFAEIEGLVAKYKAVGGSDENLDSIYRLQYKAYFNSNQIESADKVVKKAKVLFPENSFWQMRELVVARLKHDPTLPDMIKKLLNGPVKGDSMQSTLLLLGVECKNYLADYEAAAKKNPSDIRAQVTVWVASACANLKKIPDVPDTLLKLAPSDLEGYRQAYKALNDVLSASNGSEGCSNKDVARARMSMSNQFLEFFDKFENNPDCINLASDLIVGSTTGFRLLFLDFSGVWEDIAEKMPYGSTEYLQRQYLTFLNYGVHKAADPLYARLEKENRLSQEVILRSTVEALMNNDWKRAQKTFDQLKPLLMIGKTKTLYQLAEAHLKLLQGNKKAIDEYIEALKPETAFDEDLKMYVHYLKYLASEQAVPSEALLVSLMEPHTELHDVWSVGLSEVLRRCAKDTSQGAKTILLNLPGWIVSEPFNRYFVNVSWNLKPEIKLYVGTYRFKGDFVVASVPYPGTMEVTVDAKGLIVGEVKVTGDSGVIKLSGDVNGFGDVAVSFDADGKKGTGFLHLMPFEVFSKYAPGDMPQVKFSMLTTTPYELGFEVTERNSDIKLSLLRKSVTSHSRFLK